jgi:PIN domain nuclease of toxin-antitoxin system
VRKGRYRLLAPPKVWFNRLLALVGVRLAELTPEILIKSTELPGKPPADPADRIITPTARHQASFW